MMEGNTKDRIMGDTRGAEYLQGAKSAEGGQAAAAGDAAASKRQATVDSSVCLCRKNTPYKET